VVGSSVGRDGPTPLYVPSTPVYASAPSLDTADEAPPIHHAPPPPAGLPKRAREAETPGPPLGSKRAANGASGLASYDKPIVDPSTHVTQDRLGRLVSALSAKLASAPSWKQFVIDHRGESYLAPDLDSIDHSARDYLRQLRDQGVRVPLDDPPWSADTLDACALRGPHPSANVCKRKTL
jgi:hypothetical protein